MTECYMSKRDLIQIIQMINDNRKWIKNLVRLVHKKCIEIINNNDDIAVALDLIKKLNNDSDYIVRGHLSIIIELLELAISGDFLTIEGKNAFIKWKNTHLWNKKYYPVRAGFSRKKIPVVCFHCDEDEFAYSVQYAGNGHYFKTAKEMQSYYELKIKD